MNFKKPGFIPGFFIISTIILTLSIFLLSLTRKWTLEEDNLSSFYQFFKNQFSNVKGIST